MIQELNDLLNCSSASYSRFRVSCIVVTKDGQKFKGVNVEVSSYGGTICAERNAICNAITNGYKKGDFKEIHIMNSSSNIAMPCMLCRQYFIDFFDDDVKVYVYNCKGDSKVYTKEELCPYPFDGDDIL